MSREEEDTFEPIGDEPGEYVPAVFAHSAQEAELYKELLHDHDIPAILGIEAEGELSDRPSISRGVPVLVPDAFLEEASEIIADREDLDEFEDEEEEEKLELDEVDKDLEGQDELEEDEDEEEEDEFLDEDEDEDDDEEDEEDEEEEDDIGPDLEDDEEDEEDEGK